MATPLREPSRWPVRVGFVLLCIGLATLSVGSVLLYRTQNWLAGAQHVQGKVVAAKLAQGNSIPKTYHPVVGAVDETGAPFEVTGTMSVAPSPTLGTPVDLAYPPGRPEEAVIVSLFGLWVIPAVVSLVGLVLSCVGASIAVQTRRRGAASQRVP